MCKSTHTVSVNAKDLEIQVFCSSTDKLLLSVFHFTPQFLLMEVCKCVWRFFCVSHNMEPTYQTFTNNKIHME